MAKKSKAGGKKQKTPDSPLPSDLEDEVDRFHRQREKLSLRVEDDAELSDSDDDEAVMDVSDSESDGDEDEELDTDDEIEKDTRLGRLARQARALEAKLRIQAGEAEEGEEEEEEGEDKERRPGGEWGAGKRAYYDADVADLEGSDEEEALADEEAEALRLQREAAGALAAGDFGLEDDGSSSDEEDSEEDEEGAEATLGARAAGGAEIEAIPREGGDDDDARAAAVRQDALELTSLVSELRATLGEVRGRLGPLLREVRGGDLATAEGVSYLEAKHTLLVHYAASIVFYLLLKAEGRPVRDHPVIKRLVEARSYLEKVRPIDKRLQYQIDKLLAAAARSQGDDADAAAAAAGATGGDGAAARFGPRPEALLVGMGVDEEDGGGKGIDGVYRPPRLNPVSMDMDEDKAAGAEKKARRRETAAARRAARSTLVQELAAELAEAPAELRSGAPLGMDTVAALRARQRLEARDREEEDLMMRVPLSRDERKQLKAARRAGLSGKALLDDFADDVADLVEGASVDPSFSKHRASQKFGADLAAQAAGRAPRSGDADLPTRSSLTERRAKMDGARAKRAAADLDEDEYDAGTQRGARGEEDEFYTEAKSAAVAKKQRRKDSYAYSELLPPSEDPRTTGARRINSAIEKNRGLTPHRSKELKNPRKKHRIKFAEANVRRRGQVQEVRAGAAGAYGGEATGIKSRVTKSTKF